jgi:serine/threonine protein phosphatase 1
MRLLAIGDIHGCSQALHGLLDAVRPQREDLIVTLGDYIDRGPDSAGVLTRLIELRRSHRVVSLLGNHEMMMLAARQSAGEWAMWHGYGGKETLQSYATPSCAATLEDVPVEHWEFMETACRDWYEAETHFFVHANAYPEIPLDEQPRSMLLWESLTEAPPHCSGKIMVCGHTPQRDGLPQRHGHAICLDTWVYRTGWLTCLDVKTGRYWQANQAGGQREGWLEEPE